MKLNRFHAFALLAACFMQLPVSALAIHSDTLPVSEEDPPATCKFGDAIYGATCYGSYCDKTKLSCADTNYRVKSREWSDNFSEEYSEDYKKRNWRFCGMTHIMTGISCAGRYCDNVSIECSEIEMNGRVKNDCEWVGPYSEEQRFAHFGGKYASGMFCSGSYCDNRWYYVCNF